MITDKLLQGTIAEASQRVYLTNTVDPSPFGSFKIKDTMCLPVEEILDKYNGTYPPPCSIDDTTSPWTLNGASSSYRVLATGRLNQTDNYNQEDFDALWDADASGAFDLTQLVTHIDPITHDQHVLFFNPMMAQEWNDTIKASKLSLVDNHIDRYGLDYIASTTSIVTKCIPITVECGLNTTENESSIPYHCSDIFNGDLNQLPANGIERLRGWNTSFFDFENGSPRNISIASQLNPFRYNVTAVVDSVNIEGLRKFWNEHGDPQARQDTVIGIGNGRVGFAISCHSTVYDVRYSLVDGNIHVFNSTPADPRTAAIIKAPLQAGFGNYALFERAAMSVLFNELTIMETMELAFSQTFLALAAGVYVQAPTIEQRWRGDMPVTKLGKAPFYFLVICMFLYAFVVLVFTVIALSIFRRSDVREAHARLIPNE